jgi:GNAT superfamily N-acetyltransferase
MAELRIEFEPFPNEQVRQFVINGLDNFNIATTGEAAFYPVNFFLRDARGEVLGGLLGQIWGKWLHITYIWVGEVARKAGHGRALMARAEQYAVERGCVGVHVSTFSFQARPFYENLGYEVFGVLEGMPPGHSHFYLKKRLA